MLLNNVVVRTELEQQNRARLQMEAENSRNLRQVTVSENKTPNTPSWKPRLSLGWLKQLRTNTANKLA